MASRTAPDCNEPTTALRRRSPELLLADLTRRMVVEEAEVGLDFRDVLVGFAVYFDCARRLGVDPVALFDTAARGRSPALRALAGTFARRGDVTLDAFGWRLESRPDGPCYRPEPAPSRFQLRRHNRDRR